MTATREIAERYAEALYQAASEAKVQDKVLLDLRALSEVFKDESSRHFVESPLVRAEDREAAFRLALKNSGCDSLTESFVLLLAKRNRLKLFLAIVECYQAAADQAHGVTRGTVRSASPLGPEQRKRIEKTVAEVTKKQVILTYKEDPQLIGGLIAEVGSYTFDDTLSAHLNRLKEEVNRSTN